MRNLLARLRALCTGDITWEGGEREHLSWRDRWILFGVHSRNWRWVRKYGLRECGCTFNPITRRKLLTRMGCKTHSAPWLLELLDD